MLEDSIMHAPDQCRDTMVTHSKVLTTVACAGCGRMRTICSWWGSTTPGSCRHT